MKELELLQQEAKRSFENFDSRQVTKEQRSKFGNVRDCVIQTVTEDTISSLSVGEAFQLLEQAEKLDETYDGAGNGLETVSAMVKNALFQEIYNFLWNEFPD